MDGDGIISGLPADLGRLKVELQALGGVLDALSAAVRHAGAQGLLHLWATPQETHRVIPDEHMVSYA